MGEGIDRQDRGRQRDEHADASNERWKGHTDARLSTLEVQRREMLEQRERDREENRKYLHELRDGITKGIADVADLQSRDLNNVKDQLVEKIGELKQGVTKDVTDLRTEVTRGISANVNEVKLLEVRVQRLETTQARYLGGIAVVVAVVTVLANVAGRWVSNALSDTPAPVRVHQPEDHPIPTVPRTSDGRPFEYLSPVPKPDNKTSIPPERVSPSSPTSSLARSRSYHYTSTPQSRFGGYP